MRILLIVAMTETISVRLLGNNIENRVFAKYFLMYSAKYPTQHQTYRIK